MFSGTQYTVCTEPASPALSAMCHWLHHASPKTLKLSCNHLHHCPIFISEFSSSQSYSHHAYHTFCEWRFTPLHQPSYVILLSSSLLLFASIAWQLWFPSDQGGALSSGGSWADWGLPQSSLWLQSSPGPLDPFSGCWTWFQERRYPHGTQPGGQLLVAGNHSRVYLRF